MESLKSNPDIIHVENVVEMKSKFYTFIRTSENEEKPIYLFGTNTYARSFLRKHKVKIKGFISENCETSRFNGYDVISVEDFLKIYNYNKNVYIICFSENFILSKMMFIKYGFSVINNIYDGMLFIDIRIEPERDFTEKLIITDHTRSLGGIYSLDLYNYTVNKITDGYYGDIKSYKDGYIVLDDYNGLIQYDNDFNIIKTIDIENKDMHGLDYCKKDRDYIFVVESTHNAIGVYNINSGEKDAEIRISKFKTDQHHLNDVLVTENYLYISMFSLKGCFNRKNAINIDGTIARLNRKGYYIDKIIATDLKAPHTILKYNNDIFFCDSLNGRVYCNNEVICEFNGFTRGLYCNGYCLYVGQSKNRRTYDTWQYLNTSLDSGIHCYVPSTRTTTFIPLPTIHGPYSIVQSKK